MANRRRCTINEGALLRQLQAANLPGSELGSRRSSQGKSDKPRPSMTIREGGPNLPFLRKFDPTGKRRTSMAPATDLPAGPPEGARRQSLAVGGLLGKKRPSIGMMGRRVSSILRMKKLIAPTTIPDDEVIEDEIKDTDIPKEPRFSATLSAEAQFAILKGYEDVVRRNLCRNYPDYATLLQRSRTPNGGVKVNEDKHKHISVHSADHDRRERLREQLEDEWTCDSPSSLQKSDGGRSDRLIPKVIPRKSQLVMTYRTQSGIDILDTLRLTNGELFMSPRIKARPVAIKPLKDYNGWCSVWTHDFKSAKAKCVK